MKNAVVSARLLKHKWIAIRHTIVVTKSPTIGIKLLDRKIAR